MYAGDGPSLIGMNWLTQLKLDWQHIARIRQPADLKSKLQLLLKKHEVLFKQELGTVNTFFAKLQIRKEFFNGGTQTTIREPAAVLVVGLRGC